MQSLVTTCKSPRPAQRNPPRLASLVLTQSGEKLASRRHEQRRLLKNFADYCWRKSADTSCFSCAPVETLQLVGENSAADFEACRNKNFERVALYPTRNRCEYRETCSAIVGHRRKHDRRSSTCLFMASLWIKREPDQIAAIGSVRPLTRFRCQPDRRFLFRGGDFAE